MKKGRGPSPPLVVPRGVAAVSPGILYPLGVTGILLAGAYLGGEPGLRSNSGGFSARDGRFGSGRTGSHVSPMICDFKADSKKNFLDKSKIIEPSSMRLICLIFPLGVDPAPKLGQRHVAKPRKGSLPMTAAVDPLIAFEGLDLETSNTERFRLNRLNQ
ncbi:hypothetical protein BH23PLA1_BH23PLA1_36660 [soil metagenome]